MIGTSLYSAGIILMGEQGRDTAPLSIAFFFSPLVAFSILSNVIARLARQKRKRWSCCSRSRWESTGVWTCVK